MNSEEGERNMMEILQDHPGGEESRPPSEQGRGEVMSEEAKERARKRLMKVGRRGKRDERREGEGRGEEEMKGGGGRSGERRGGGRRMEGGKEGRGGKDRRGESQGERMRE